MPSQPLDIKSYKKNEMHPMRIKQHSLIFLLTIPLFWVVLSGNRDPEIEQKPDDNRFTKIVLAENLDEPMGMAFLPENKVLIIERKGAVKIYDPKKKLPGKIATIPVNTTVLRNGKIAHIEEGLMGVITHPDFDKNHWIYFYYADPDQPRHVLARWNLVNDRLIASSKKIIMDIPIRREPSKCMGGSMVFDKSGNLFLAVGTNTIDIKPDTIRSPDGDIIINTTETETAGNTNDLRGKILRIQLNDNGSYSIPEGNLFPKGMEKTKAEIYVMGTRNPWRISIDSKTGYLYWADPGRDDNNLDKDNIKGVDEFNEARKAGNFGWPFFVGNNHPYYGVHDISKKSEPLSTKDHPLNSSVYNTGLKEIPAATESLIWYKYGLSDLFPILGNGGRSAVGGPVYRRADFSKALRPFPSYYEGKWFISDFIRGWIMMVSLDENENLKSIDPFLPNENFSSVLDMNFSPSGDLYILEYGTKWYSGNANARLVKIEYEAGNRKPKVKAAADKIRGAAPMKVQLNSSGTFDFDQDSLSYQWVITGNGTKKIFRIADPVVILQKPGKYQAKLIVTDSKGASSFSSLTLEAGNEPPVVEFNLINANQTFFFEDDSLQYTVQVKDKEDGSLANSRIKPASVYASVDYTSLPYNQLSASLLNPGANLRSGISTGKILIQQQDCKSCHMMTTQSAGPSYVKIAARYKNTPKAGDLLADKIIKGGSGVWGNTAMSAHPSLTKSEAKAIGDYIIALARPQKIKKLPLKGTYKLKVPPDQSPYGSFVLTAAYRDGGSSSMAPQTGQALKILRYPVLYPRNAEFQKGTRLVTTPSREFLIDGDGAYFGFKSIDLSGINMIKLSLFAEKWKGVAGGYVECYLDSLQGLFIGKSQMVEVVENRTRVKEGFSLSGKQINGSHDIYFVFKNPDAAAHQLLMEVYAVEFNK
jgi:cytochrome c